MTTAIVQQRFSVAPKLWPDSTIVCIGGGSSLTREDVEYCRNRVSLIPKESGWVGSEQIEPVYQKVRVIAIKEAFLLAPWADVLYAADWKWWNFYHREIEAGRWTAFDGLKFGIEQLQPEYPPIDWPGIDVLHNTGSTGLELDPSGLKIGNNSGHQSVNLAVHFGAKRIVVIGFDCWTGPNGQQNWFGDHPLHLKSPYPLFLQQWATIVEPLKAIGVEVINCSRWTMLRAFPQKPLEEVLG